MFAVKINEGLLQTSFTRLIDKKKWSPCNIALHERPPNPLKIQNYASHLSAQFLYINPTIYHAWRKAHRCHCIYLKCYCYAHLFPYTLRNYLIFDRTNSNRFSFRFQLAIVKVSSLLFRPFCNLFDRRSYYFIDMVYDFVQGEQL